MGQYLWHIGDMEVKMSKKIVFLLAVTIAFSCFAVTAFAAVKTSSVVTLDGKTLNASSYSPDEAYYADEVYLPLRAISEALGYKVEWSQADKVIVVSNDNKKIIIDQDNYRVTLFDLKNNSDYTYYMEQWPIVYKNTTYVPQEFLMDEFNLKIDWDKTTGNVKMETVKPNSIKIINKVEGDETKQIVTKLQYPQLDGLENKTVQNKINSTFKKLAEDAKVMGNDALADIDSSFFENHQFEVDLNYKITYNQNGLLSVVFDNYQYYGGAHGSTLQIAYTFNLKDGTQYKLSDMFKDKTDYVTLLSKIVKQKLKERGLSEGVEFDKIAENQEFYLDNNGVKVYFQQYAVGCYALGILEFRADYDDVRDVLNTELGL
jgi:inhibitor of cysteine peptidase